MLKNILNSISSNFYPYGVREDIDTTEKIINECTDKFEEIRLYLENALNKTSKKKGAIQFKKSLSDGFYLELTNSESKDSF